MNNSKSKPAASPIHVEVVPSEATPMALSRSMQKKIDTAPISVLGTWDGARQWIADAKRAHEFALACQVMVGFELLTLREQHGEIRGGDKRSGNAPQSSGPTFIDRAQEETGLGHGTIYRFMAMAEKAAPILRKRAQLLRGFDPRAVPLSSLPSPQLDALSSAVRKLTDGLTQSEFLVELGLAKAPQGSRTTGGARDRKAPLSLSDQVAVKQQLAREDWAHIEICLHTSGTRFLLLDDAEVRRQIDVLEAHLRGRKEWVSQPREKRKPAAIEDILMAVQPSLG